LGPENEERGGGVKKEGAIKTRGKIGAVGGNYIKRGQDVNKRGFPHRPKFKARGEKKFKGREVSGVINERFKNLIPRGTYVKAGDL